VTSPVLPGVLRASFLRVTTPVLAAAFGCLGAAQASPFNIEENVQPTAAPSYDVADDLAAQHLRDNLLDEVFDDFRLFIYVDKARTGLLAQRMFVFDKTGGGNLALLYDWPVSTGRDQTELDAAGSRQSTATPSGFFELDPRRMYEAHVSAQWGEAMPYAMFFNWRPNGRPTGLAIHGTPDENLAELGTAASAGCIRLSFANARTLFNLIQTQYWGPAPTLAYLNRDDGPSSEGLLLHDQAGHLEMADGYSVLVFIDDLGGEGHVSSVS